MSQIIVDPDEQRAFASFLDSLVASLSEKRGNTAHAFERLRQTWKDARYSEFEKNFAAASADLDQFLAAAKAYADFLRRKAQKADDYLRR